MRRLYKRFSDFIVKRESFKNVFTLMTGTIASQVVSALSMMLLARIYSPEDFGVYSLFIAIAGVISVMAAGRYELAIVLPSDKIFGANMVALCVLLAGITTIMLYGMIVGVGPWLLVYFDQMKLMSFLWILPIYVFSLSSYQALYYWFNREKKFKLMAQSRFLVVLLNALISTIMGLINPSFGGLVFGAVGAQMVTNLYLLRNFYCAGCNGNISFATIYVGAKRYINCPKFLMLGHTLGNISEQLPIFLLNVFYGPNIVGYFTLGQRCINMPMTLLTRSVGDVFRQRAVSEYNRCGECSNLFNKTAKQLAIVSFFPLILLAFAAPSIFEMLFGGEWEMAGVYTQILIPMYFFKSVVSPLSNIALAAEKQKEDFGLQLFIVLTLVSFMYFGHWFYGNDTSTVAFFGLGYVVVYAVVFFFMRKWARGL